MRPRRYYGWTITWALALTQTVGFGVLYYAFSVFVLPMEAELGWSRAQSAGAFSLALLMSGLAAPLCGRWVDQHGARGLMTSGSLLGTLLVLAWANVHDLRLFYLIQAGIGLAMAAVLYDVAFTVLAVWFRARRHQAMLIVTLVAGLASTIFVPLAALLEARLGWRGALGVLALVLAFGTIPLHALVLRRRPEDLGLTPDGLPHPPRAPEPAVRPLEALRTSAFWWLSLAFALSRLTIIAVAAHSIPILLERGYGPSLAAAAVGAIGLTQLAGRVFFTPATARLPLSSLAALTFGLHALALLALLLPTGLGLWLFAGLFGLANGAVTLVRAALVAERFGTAHFGGVNGNMALLIALVQTAAPLGAGLLHDLSDSYTPVIWALAGVSLSASFAVLQLRPRREAAYAD